MTNHSTHAFVFITISKLDKSIIQTIQLNQLPVFTNQNIKTKFTLITYSLLIVLKLLIIIIIIKRIDNNNIINNPNINQ